ncbi:cysteine desulfurase NifS [Brachyspira aalborgi]|jgi:cysteine desulfurase|uniref:Cysteine desulfurase n=1 Tax=Brachyspira aalborgi TaxID=29522 RepID=A0AB38PUJ5_9SPIR|nr:cysteine desulfurase NifS [Brachyspira aalborgi]MBS4764263.1 cysteine desulfurase NifS [Brachyspira sp.]CCY74743.1 nifS Cysteine sulfinate desulfinase/cysteine desulfurase-like enzyme [Brachyspira sp. CAG:700]TXJ15232.1 cysteine desulfurase NifS [Brachyspira aalborgi]TXJ18131.1 cysteine desulfurase NifS [Brachyspira aalborgi]TXJ24086.1 cysteine desulfurase NifS [Brachyspira aalborgi]
MENKKLIYMDNNATTRVYEEVLEAMLPYFKEKYFNPSSMYSVAGGVHKEMEKAREQVADFLGCEKVEVCFVSCGSEGDNMAIRGTIEAYPTKNHIITTKVEHPAVIETCKSLERLGYRITLLDVDNDGNINLEELKKSVNENTAIVSIMYANNETGVIFPIKEIGEIVKNAGAVLHVDAVQAAGKLPLNMKNEPYIDMLTIAGHKIHAPKGIGALYIKNGTKLRTVQTGGHQERGRRAGTENVPYIVGLGKACSMVKSELPKFNEHTSKLRDKLEEEVSKRISDIKINGKNANRVSNTTNISFKNIEGESVLLLLDGYGICTSSGSACSSGTLEPSPVLQSMGVPFEYAHSSTRFSLSLDNTMEEINYTADALEKIVSRLRDISPYRN